MRSRRAEPVIRTRAAWLKYQPPRGSYDPAPSSCQRCREPFEREELFVLSARGLGYHDECAKNALRHYGCLW